MSEMTVKEYALKTGKSEQTIKRWLKSGRVLGYQRETPQGFMWYVTVDESTRMPDDMLNGTTAGASHDMSDEGTHGVHATDAISSGEVSTLREMIGFLKQEIDGRDRQLETRDLQTAEKDKQIEQLHILLKNGQDRMLPAPKESDPRPWWMRWLGIQTTTSNPE